MPYPARFLVVPLSEVPAPVSSIKVGGLEAILMNDKHHDTSPSSHKSGPIRYEVRGLPHGQKAWILQENEVRQVIRQIHGESEWLGKYETTEEALHALASKAP